MFLLCSTGCRKQFTTKQKTIDKNSAKTLPLTIDLSTTIFHTIYSMVFKYTHTHTEIVIHLHLNNRCWSLPPSGHSRVRHLTVRPHVVWVLRVKLTTMIETSAQPSPYDDEATAAATGKGTVTVTTCLTVKSDHLLGTLF